MKKLSFIILLVTSTFVCPASYAQNSDSLTLVSLQNQYGAHLWTMLAENYSRFDSIGCEWSDWTSDGLVFSWLDRRNCQVARYRDNLRVTFYNYHLKKGRAVCIVLIQKENCYVFTANDQKSGSYYRGKISSAYPLPLRSETSRLFSRLTAGDCREFNHSIKDIMKTIGRHTENIRD